MAEPLSLGHILSVMESQNKIDWKSMTPKQRKAIHSMMICHTAECGFTSEYCTQCGEHFVHYGSCNNSSCPQCGSMKREEWAVRMAERSVNAPAFHLVFTIPAELNSLALCEKEAVYKAMFDASAAVIKEFAADSKYLGAVKCGFISVIHSWGSNISVHPHIHTIFQGAGLDENDQLVVSNGKFLFPAKAVAAKFKGKLLALLEKQFDGDGSVWHCDLAKARFQEWNVEIKPCPGDPRITIKYLSRYINRTAISNGRLISYKNGKVRFRYKNYKKGGKMSEMELEDTEFLRRFLMHIFPEGFVRARYYGFMSNNSSELLKKVQDLAGSLPEKNLPDEEQTDAGHSGLRIVEADVEYGVEELEYHERACPKCGCHIFRSTTYPRRIPLPNEGAMSAPPFKVMRVLSE